MTSSDFPSEPATDHRVRVILKDRKARPFFGRHPWVFESAIDAVESPSGEVPAAGTEVELHSAKGQFIAHGLWNPESTIRVRLYSWNAGRPVNDELISERIGSAIDLRSSQFDLKSADTGCRLIFSEGDHLSGLTVDYYGGFLLVQFTGLGMHLRQDAIVRSLKQKLESVGMCHGIWLRTEKGMREAEGLQAVDGLLDGTPPPRPLFIEDHGVRFGIDVQQGQKTGYYLDQRDNRRAAAEFAHGNVLDAFCYSGGFGITAAGNDRGVKVTGVDSSEPALTMAAANAELNGVADRCTWKRADVRAELESLAEAGAQFDTVILDPPKMARTRGGLSRALKGYRRLNLAGLNVLRPGGILVTCSCSGLVSAAEFQEVIADSARESGRDIQILQQLGQPPDHPVSATCPESAYLKMLICRVK